MILYLFISLLKAQILVESHQNQTSQIQIQNPDYKYEFLLQPSGKFQINGNDKNMLEILDDKLILNAPTFVDDLQCYDNVQFGQMQQNQWNQHIFQIFTDTYDWEGQLSQCGQSSLLGGYKSHSKTLKNIFALPKHAYVKIVFNYAVIDQWQGQVMYLKANIHQNTVFI